MEYHTNERIQRLIEEIEQHIAEEKWDLAASGVMRLREHGEREKDYVALAATCVYAGMVEFSAGNVERSIELRKRALAIGQSHNEPYYSMRAYNGLAVVYSDQGDYYSSLGNYLNAFHIASAHPEFGYECIILNNVGNLFVWLLEFEMAAGYLTSAYETYLERQMADRALLASIVQNLIEAYSCAGEFQLAKEWAENGQVQLLPQERVTVKCMLLANDVQMYYEQGELDKASETVEAFLKCAEQTREFLYLFRSFLSVGQVSVNLGDYDQSTRVMERIVELDKRAPMDNFRYDFAELRVMYYRQYLKMDADCALSDNYYEFYYWQSLRTVEQLRRTYMRSLFATLEMDREKFASNSVMRKSFGIEKDLEKDPLTGLYNRASIEKYVAGRLAARKQGERQVLCLVRIDRFKELNDAYGHHFGDMLLLEVSDILNEGTRRDLVVSRYGGGEFLEFLDHAGDLERVLEKAQTQLERAEKIALPDDSMGKLTFSIGVCVIEKPLTFAEAVSRATKAMESATGSGMERYVVYQE